MGKYRCILDKFYKKIIAVIFWEIIKRYFAQKIDEYRRKIDFMHEINWKKRDFICKKHSLYQYYML